MAVHAAIWQTWKCWKSGYSSLDLMEKKHLTLPHAWLEDFFIKDKREISSPSVLMLSWKCNINVRISLRALAAWDNVSTSRWTSHALTAWAIHRDEDFYHLVTRWGTCTGCWYAAYCSVFADVYQLWFGMWHVTMDLQCWPWSGTYPDPHVWMK